MHQLPAFTNSKLTTDQFLDVLMLAEFFECFGEQLDPIYQSEFQNGIELSLIESSVLSFEPNSSFGEILQCLLATSLTMLKDDEQKLKKEENGIDSYLELAEDHPYKEIIPECIESANLPQKLYGQSIFNLSIDNCTISEVLRLYLLSSGSRFFSSSRTNDRRQKGCIMFYDDPGVEFLLSHK